MPSWIDGSLYPDVEPPDELPTEGDRIDFLARLCGAWDFGVLPEAETILEIQRPAWRDVVERTNMPTSPSYHLLRRWHGLPEAPSLVSVPAYIRDDPSLRFI